MIRHLIWDWNGTLLDDVDCCVDTLNTLLAERDMPPVSRSAYKEAFGFPVRDYYAGLGFDFEREDFAKLSVDFIARYRARLNSVKLQKRALDLVQCDELRGRGGLVEESRPSLRLGMVANGHCQRQGRESDRGHT